MSKPRMKVVTSEDNQTAVLSFLEGSGISGEIALDAAQLQQLITSLGVAHAKLTEGQPVPPLDGATFSPVYQTRWALQLDALTEGSLLAFQHPAYGPVGLVFSPRDAEQVINGLQKHRTIVHSTPDHSRQPS